MRIEKQTSSTRREIVFYLALASAMVCAFTALTAAQSREMPAIVSPDWLSKNLSNPGMVILDIRSVEQYKKGHIPGSLNTPLSLWAVNRDGLTLELPPEDALRDLIGKSGIDASSHIVIVNRIDTDFNRADSTRVAWTCSYAGIQNTAILDGGYNRWLKEIKSTSTEISNAKPGVYTGKINPTVLASKAYVSGKLGRSVIVDTRLPEDYFGIASKPGHIKHSVNLPTPWAFANDGTLRKVEDLQAMASGVIGENKSQEVILYCGVGGYASTWWFLLTHLLGYQNVKVYDGSMEEWVKDPQSPVTAYCWH